MDMREFLKNRSQVSASELERHSGKYVAWSPDGKKIIAADHDPIKIVDAVKSIGYDPAECVLSSIPAPEEIVLGGGLDERGFPTLQLPSKSPYLRSAAVTRDLDRLSPSA
jgi:hypothetical protein